MVDELIPADLRDFILRHIDTVAQWEALLLLRANPADTWDVGKIARRLYASDSDIADLLKRLCQGGIRAAALDPQTACCSPGFDTFRRIGRVLGGHGRPNSASSGFGEERVRPGGDS